MYNFNFKKLYLDMFLIKISILGENFLMCELHSLSFFDNG